MAKIPLENQPKLDQKIDDDIELAEISSRLTRWEGVLPYLGLKETDQEEIEISRTIGKQR